MNIQNNQNKIASMLLILVSLFIFVFFTKNYYSDLIISMDQHETKTSEYNTTKQKLDTLSQKQKELESSGDLQGGETAKYLQGLHEDELLREFYTYTQKNTKNGEIKISNIRFGESQKNELGFHQTSIDVSITIPNTKALQDFLDFIIENEKYKFFVTNLSLPKKLTRKTKIQIPITYYYKEL